jgi:hypothetical protein
MSFGRFLVIPKLIIRQQLLRKWKRIKLIGSLRSRGIYLLKLRCKVKREEGRKIYF